MSPSRQSLPFSRVSIWLVLAPLFSFPLLATASVLAIHHDVQKLTPHSFAGNLRFTITHNGLGSQQFIDAPTHSPGEGTHVAINPSGNRGTLYVSGAAVAS